MRSSVAAREPGPESAHPDHPPCTSGGVKEDRNDSTAPQAIVRLLSLMKKSRGVISMFAPHVDRLHLAAQPLVVEERVHHDQRIAQDHAIDPAILVLIRP